MFARSPHGRRRHPSRKATWSAARFSPAPTQAAALLAFQTPTEAPVPYPYEDPYDPDESVDALLEEVDDLLGGIIEDDEDDEDDLGFQLFPKMRERAEERREARQEKREKRETERSERRERETKERGEGRTHERERRDRRTKERAESRVQREKETRLREQQAAERYEAEKVDRKAAAATRRRDQELAEMRFSIEKAKLATALAELKAAKSKSASTAAKVSGFGDAEVREARKEARKQKQRTRAAKKAMKAARSANKQARAELRKTKKEKRQERVEAKGSKAMQPIFDPAHNLREASKQMLLLEDHLFQPPRQCPDCIRKHLLTAEALAEEAATLDKELEWQMWTSVLPAQYRQWLVALEEDGSPTRKTQIANQVRQVRKNLVTALGSSNKIGVAEQVKQVEPVGSQARRRPHRRRLVRYAAEEEIPHYVEVKDADGNTWSVRSNKTIEQIEGPLEGEQIKPSDGDFYDSVVADLAKNDPMVSKILGAGAVTKARGATNPYIKGLEAKDKVVFGYRTTEDETKIVSWRVGEVASVGEDVAGYPVEAIPQDGWVPLYFKNAEGKWLGKWAKSADVVRIQPGKSASSILQGKIFNLYTEDRGIRGGKLNDRQLAMADLIQTVMQARLGDPYAKFTAASVDAPQALRLSVLSKIIAAAIVNAGYESWFDPMNKTGDGGKAVGLFQLHSGGAGRGMTVAQRQNPIVNTETITNELIMAMNTPPGQSSEIRGEVYKLMVDAATGENPSVADWTFAFTVDVERPWDRVGSGNRRRKTAEELFPSKRRVPVPSKRVPIPMLAPAVVRAAPPLVVPVTSAPSDPPWKNPWVLGASAVAVLMTGAWAFSGSPQR